MRCPHCHLEFDPQPKTPAERSAIYRANALKRWEKRWKGESVNKLEHIKRKESP